MERIYNDNITLLGIAEKTDALKEDEYFVLMVTDYDKHGRPKEDYWDWDKEYIGLERPSNNGAYISKSYNERHKPLRGITFIARVKDIKKCYNLVRIKRE